LAGNCVDSCPEGYFDGKETCKRCDPVCKTCDAEKTSCRSCHKGYVLKNTDCQITCTGATYRKLNKCVDCDKTCAACENAKTCTKCSAGFALN